MPYCFWSHTSNCKVTRLKKSSILTQIGRLRTVTPVFNSQAATKWCIKLEIALTRCPIVFQSHPSNFKVTRLKNCRIWPRLGVSGLSLQFEFTNGYEMMHKACSSIEEMPYCLSISSVKFQGHTVKKIVYFDPNWAFPECNSSLNSLMTTKWCTMLEVA